MAYVEAAKQEITMSYIDGIAKAAATAKTLRIMRSIRVHSVEMCNKHVLAVVFQARGASKLIDFTIMSTVSHYNSSIESIISKLINRVINVVTISACIETSTRVGKPRSSLVNIPDVEYTIETVARRYEDKVRGSLRRAITQRKFDRLVAEHARSWSIQEVHDVVRQALANGITRKQIIKIVDQQILDMIAAA